MLELFFQRMVGIGVAVNPKCQCSCAYPPFQAKPARKLGSPFCWPALAPAALPSQALKGGIITVWAVDSWNDGTSKKTASPAGKQLGEIEGNSTSREMFVLGEPWCGLGTRFPLCSRAFLLLVSCWFLVSTW